MRKIPNLLNKQKEISKFIFDVFYKENLIEWKCTFPDIGDPPICVPSLKKIELPLWTFDDRETSFAKQYFLHEVVHALIYYDTNEDENLYRWHDEIFYRKYVSLLKKYMCGKNNKESELVELKGEDGEVFIKATINNKGQCKTKNNALTMADLLVDHIKEINQDPVVIPKCDTQLIYNFLLDVAQKENNEWQKNE